MKLRESLAESATKTSFVKESPDRSRIIEKGKAYLEFMRGLEKKKKKSSPNSEGE